MATHRIAHRIQSLKLITSRKLVVHLWKNVRIMNAVLDGSWKYYAMNAPYIPNNNFDSLADIVVGKLRDLLLDEVLVREVSCLIKLMGVKICYWISENSNCIPITDPMALLNSIQWTHNGCILERNSINNWVRHTEPIIIFKRVCHFCFESQICNLWIQMSEFARNYYRNVSENDILLKYWVHRIHNTMDEFLLLLKAYSREFFNLIDDDEFPLHLDADDFELESINMTMVWFSITNSNANAVSYFLSKFEPQVASDLASNCMETALYYESINQSLLKLEPAAVVFRLYFAMKEIDRLFFLQHHTKAFFSLMTNYSRYQSHLIPAVSSLGNTLSIDIFSELVENVFKGLATKQYLHARLLRSIWYVTPNFLKSGFFRHIFSNINMLHMFEGETFYISKYLLEDASTSEKNEMFSFFEI